MLKPVESSVGKGAVHPRWTIGFGCYIPEFPLNSYLNKDFGAKNPLKLYKKCVYLKILKTKMSIPDVKKSISYVFQIIPWGFCNN